MGNETRSHGPNWLSLRYISVCWLETRDDVDNRDGTERNAKHLTGRERQQVMEKMYKPDHLDASGRSAVFDTRVGFFIEV